MSKMTTKQLADQAIANLPRTTSLGFVDRDDALHLDQVQALFTSPEANLDTYAEVDDSYSEGIAANVDEYIREALDDKEAFEQLEADQSQYERVKEVVESRDRATLMKDLLRNTGDVLLRYRLLPNWDDYPVARSPYRWSDEEMEEQIALLAVTVGVDANVYHKELKEVLENADGGSPELLWYAKPRTLLDHMRSDAEGRDWLTTGTLTFKDPVLLVIDAYNGSGHDVRLKGATITVPFTPTRIAVDGANANGYGWDSIANVVKSAYAAEVTFTPTDLDTPKGPSLSL